MASGAFTQTAVLDIVDSSEHMATGGIKDAAYIADMFKPHLKELDPLGKNSDLVLFDGASNVQKAGEIIGARHPRVSCLHAAEHVVSLVFSDIAKLWQVNVLVGIYRKAFAVFGSGSMHGPYAIFQTHARQHNDGKVS